MSSTLPSELYKPIMEYLSSSPQALLASSLSSRYLLAPAQIVLFGSINLATGAAYHVEVKSRLFLDSLRQGPHLQSYVHDLKLGYHGLCCGEIEAILSLLHIKRLSICATYWTNSGGGRWVSLDSWHELSATLQHVLIHHTFPELSALSLIDVKYVTPRVLLACKMIVSIDITKSTFTNMEDTGGVSAPSLNCLRLEYMFWDTMHPDKCWLWRFLSSCRHLSISDEETRTSKRRIGLDNYSRLLLACSKNLRSLHLDTWLVRVSMHDLERIFQLSLFPQLEYLSFTLPRRCLPSSSVPKPLILSISNLFSRIVSGHPIQCLNIQFSSYKNPTSNVPQTSEWSVLGDTLSTSTLSRIQINLGGEDDDLARSLFYSAFSKCCNRVVFAVKISGYDEWGWKGGDGTTENSKPSVFDVQWWKEWTY